MPLAPTNFNALLTKLAQAGLDNDFPTSKLLPTTDIARLDGSAGPADEARLIAHTADVASRVFGWTKKELFAPAALAPPRYAAAEARFKIPARRRTRATNLYAAYANYLAVVVLKACEALPRSPIPADVDAFRAALLGRYGTINLRNTVCFAWDLGETEARSMAHAGATASATSLSLSRTRGISRAGCLIFRTSCSTRRSIRSRRRSK